VIGLVIETNGMSTNAVTDEKRASDKDLLGGLTSSVGLRPRVSPARCILRLASETPVVLRPIRRQQLAIEFYQCNPS
jgi:hypothetical protein